MALLQPPFRYVAWCAYLVAVLMVAGPLGELAGGAWPWLPSSIQWRFATVGLLANAIPMPLTGLLLAFAAAVLLEQRRVLRMLAVGSSVLAGILLLLTGLFALDALQLRPQITPTGKSVFDFNVAKATVYQLVAVAVLIGFATAAARARRHVRREDARGGWEA